MSSAETRPAGVVRLLAPALLAHRWPVAALVLVLCLGIGVGAGAVPVEVPLANDPVPLWTLLAIVATVAAMLPLASAFPELERTLVREPSLRTVRATVSVVMVALVLSPAWVGTDGRAARHVLLVFVVLLLAAGLVAVVTLGELAWTVPVAGGLAELVVDGSVGEPLSGVLRQVPVAAALVGLLLALALLAWRGPRRS